MSSSNAPQGGRDEPDSRTRLARRIPGEIPGRSRFRDVLAQDSGGALATLLRPLAEFDGAWMNYPGKKDHDVKFW